MANYNAMKVNELRQAVLETGTNPLGWTKAQMVQWMQDYEKAHSMKC